VTLFIAVLGGTAVHGQTGTVLATVRTTLPAGESVAMPGVRVTVTCGSGAALSHVSDERGQVQFSHVPSGSCSLETDVQGFQQLSTHFEVPGTERIDLPLSLELKPMYTGLMVISPPLKGPLGRVTSTTWSRRRTCDQEAGSR
jgi:hypothetical protein